MTLISAFLKGLGLADFKDARVFQRIPCMMQEEDPDHSEPQVFQAVPGPSRMVRFVLPIPCCSCIATSLEPTYLFYACNTHVKLSCLWPFVVSSLFWGVVSESSPLQCAQ